MQRCDVVDIYNKMGYNMAMNKTYITNFGKEETARLKTELADLLVKRIKLDQFFDKYLDKFDSEMKPNKPDTPVWKLYHKKYDEYNELSRKITTTEHLLRRVGNV